MISRLSTDGNLSLIGNNSMYINDSGHPDTGKIRYNTTLYRFEVHDGYSYVEVGQHVTISLSPQIETVIKWAESKMIEEQSLQDRLNKYPALKTAYDNFKLINQITLDQE